MAKKEKLKLEAIPQANKVVEIASLRREKEFLNSPIHTLTRGGKRKKLAKIHIEDEKNGVKSRWKVTPNAEYGAPGELAYKIDRLHIDKLIEQAGPEKPKVLRLGSLQDIAASVGMGRVGGSAARSIKNALLQNAFASIEVKRQIQLQNGGSRWLEGAFNRYSVFFKGEQLPDSSKAEEVTIIFSDPWVNILNSVGTRPLNYEYLKVLPPISQRFYEMVAPKIFACIKHSNPHAVYSYAEFCSNAPQKRNKTWRTVYKQMYKLIKPHLDNGYLASWEGREALGGEPDWELLLVPGELAYREYEAFTGKPGASLPSPSKSIQTQARELVTYFWKQKGVHKPQGLSKKDVNTAKVWIEAFEFERLKFAIDYALSHPTPPSFFGGVKQYFPEAFDAYGKSQTKTSPDIEHDQEVWDSFVDEKGRRFARKRKA